MLNVDNPMLCEQLNRVHLNLLCFGYARADTGWRGENILPLYSRLYYITGGEAQITLATGEKITLRAGGWYLFPVGCSFEFECADFLEHIYFHLKVCGCDGIDLLRACEKPLRYASCERSDFMIKCIKSDSLTEALALRQIISRALLEIITENGISITSERHSPCVERAISYIGQNLSARLGVEEIAEYACVSKSTLTKHFRSELSTSVGGYIYDAVMYEAGRMLLDRDSSVLEVSERLGFYDQFYFSRRFKEKFGKSPREYRKAYRSAK